MMAGFFRRKSRKAMRQGAAVPARWTFAEMRLGKIASYLKGMVQLLWEMQELWLSTRPRSVAEERLVGEMTRIYGMVQRRSTVSELELAYERAKTHLPALKVPSRFTLCWQKWNLFYAGSRVLTRSDIHQSWSRIVTWIRCCKFPCVSLVHLLSTLWLELQINAMFAHALFQSRNRKLGLDA